MPIKRVILPTLEPVSLQEAKLHLKVQHSLDDSLITGLISAVRLAAEHACERTMLLTTWELTLDNFPAALELRYPVVQSITSVKFDDTNGVEQVLHPDDYRLDAASLPGWLVPSYGKTWPATRCQVNAVRVRYVAGYGADAADVPENVKLWMKLHIGHYYKNREASVDGTINALPFLDSLLDPERVWSI